MKSPKISFVTCPTYLRAVWEHSRSARDLRGGRGSGARPRSPPCAAASPPAAPHSNTLLLSCLNTAAMPLFGQTRQQAAASQSDIISPCFPFCRNVLFICLQQGWSGCSLSVPGCCAAPASLARPRCGRPAPRSSWSGSGTGPGPPAAAPSRRRGPRPSAGRCGAAPRCAGRECLQYTTV